MCGVVCVLSLHLRVYGRVNVCDIMVGACVIYCLCMCIVCRCCDILVRECDGGSL